MQTRPQRGRLRLRQSGRLLESPGIRRAQGQGQPAPDSARPHGVAGRFHDKRGPVQAGHSRRFCARALQGLQPAHVRESHPRLDVREQIGVLDRELRGRLRRRTAEGNRAAHAAGRGHPFDGDDHGHDRARPEVRRPLEVGPLPPRICGRQGSSGRPGHRRRGDGLHHRLRRLRHVRLDQRLHRHGFHNRPVARADQLRHRLSHRARQGADHAELRLRQHRRARQDQDRQGRRREVHRPLRLQRARGRAARVVHRHVARNGPPRRGDSAARRLPGDGSLRASRGNHGLRLSELESAGDPGCRQALRNVFAGRRHRPEGRRRIEVPRGNQDHGHAEFFRRPRRARGSAVGRPLLHRRRRQGKLLRRQGEHGPRRRRIDGGSQPAFGCEAHA